MTTRPPSCLTCKVAARLTDGREVYPHRSDLHDKPIWKCDGCRGYVGCHPGTTRPLGTPADKALRYARMKLHNSMIDPLWQGRKKARGKVYGYLAEQLGLSVQDTHVGMFDIETCRRAWKALRGVTFAQIEEWSSARRKAA